MVIAAALVLGGALAAGQRFRIYDAVVLKTLFDLTSVRHSGSPSISGVPEIDTLTNFQVGNSRLGWRRVLNP